MNRRAGAQGIGHRHGRGPPRRHQVHLYEAPGAVALIEAHQALESVTLERMQRRYKRQPEQTWENSSAREFCYSPLKKSMDAFIERHAGTVSGDIRMRGGRAANQRSPLRVLAVTSLATYRTGDTFDQSSRGFIDIYGLRSARSGP